MNKDYVVIISSATIVEKEKFSNLKMSDCDPNYGVNRNIY